MFFVYGCLKCHRPASLRIVESRTSFRPKVFKCFICGRTRSVKNSMPFFVSEDYLEVLDYVKRWKLKRFRVMGL